MKTENKLMYMAKFFTIEGNTFNKLYDDLYTLISMFDIMDLSEIDSIRIFSFPFTMNNIINLFNYNHSLLISEYIFIKEIINPE